MQKMKVRPSHPDSYRLCHETEQPAFMLPLREPKLDLVVEALGEHTHL